MTQSPGVVRKLRRVECGVVGVAGRGYRAGRAGRTWAADTKLGSRVAGVAVCEASRRRAGMDNSLTAAHPARSAAAAADRDEVRSSPAGRVLGVPYALVLSVLTGVLDLIPLVRSLIAAVVVALVALATVSPTASLVTVVFYVFYRLFEDYLLNPRVLQRTVDVSPLVTIIAVVLGGALLIVGAIVAVPAAAAVQLVLSRSRLPQPGSGRGGSQARGRAKGLVAGTGRCVTAGSSGTRLDSSGALLAAAGPAGQAVGWRVSGVSRCR